MELHNGICPPNTNIYTFFKDIVDRDNAKEINLFLHHLKNNFLNNSMFNKSKDYSLGYACKNDKFNTALTLIKSGNVDLGLKDSKGQTPLMLCCNNKDDEMFVIIAKELLKGDCKPEETYNRGFTALTNCLNSMTNTNLTIASMILDRDPNLAFHIDPEGNSSLDLVISYYEDQQDYMLNNKLYIDLCVRLFEIYSEGDQGDGVFTRVMESMCIDETNFPLRRVLDKPFARIGIDFNDYCNKPPMKTEATILQATLNKPGRRTKMAIEAAEAIPFAVGEREQGVSPSGRYAPNERNDPEGFAQYERLYPPAGLYPRSSGGTKCKTKKYVAHNKQKSTRCKHK